MLQTVLQNFLTMMGIIGSVAVITFLISIIIIIITTTIDTCQEKKIKDKLLRELHKKLGSTIQDMDKQTIDKNNKQ